MKSILYIGATLMIGASIYGFVDYQKTSHKREFKNMYTEPAQETPVTAAVKTEPVTNVTDAEKTKAATAVTSNTATVKKTAVAKVKKYKRRSFKLSEFSRAPIREVEMAPEKAGDEIKKVEIKEQ